MQTIKNLGGVIKALNDTVIKGPFGSAKGVIGVLCLTLIVLLPVILTI